MKQATTTNGFVISTLGNIKWNDNEEHLNESTVEMSERNFRILLSLIPKTDESKAVHIDCLRLRAKMNELSYKTDRTRKEYNEILESELAYSIFVEDIKEFNTPDIKIVGKIDLNKYV